LHCDCQPHYVGNLKYPQFFINITHLGLASNWLWKSQENNSKKICCNGPMFLHIMCMPSPLLLEAWCVPILWRLMAHYCWWNFYYSTFMKFLTPTLYVHIVVIASNTKVLK
jgi:hypothetical protein